MRNLFVFPALLAVATVAACAQVEPPRGTPPVATAPSGNSAQMPQPPNSVPPGAAVSGSVTPATGMVNETQVGPSTPPPRPVRPVRPVRRPPPPPANSY